LDEIAIAAPGMALNFHSGFGIIARLAVSDGGRQVAPFHTAPWVGSEDPMPKGTPPHLARLGGDFFCAPFGMAGEAPLHGWPANSPWRVTRAEDGRLEAELMRRVSGARLEKRLELRGGEPFLYQSHLFTGGRGRLPVANHACLALPAGGLIRTSPKRAWRSGATAPEPHPGRGRSALRYPAEARDPTRFPGAAGPVDLTRYPWGPAHEDFVVGLEAEGSPLGWTAVTRPEEGDLYLSLRNPRALPMTMLWHSNGGRDYAPWSGRHRGCLGVEEGCAPHMLEGPGLPEAPALVPDGTLEIRHLTGAIAWPSGEPVASVVPGAGGITVTGEGGARRDLPCDPGFLRL